MHRSLVVSLSALVVLTASPAFVSAQSEIRYSVTVHNGMHGVGDMNRAPRDWRGPVARVTIRRVQ